MARKTTLIILVLCILTSVQAQGVRFEQKNGLIEISSSVAGYSLTTDDNGLIHFEADGWAMKNRALGEPELPVETRIFALPKNASYSLEIISQVSWNMTLSTKICPSDGPHIKDFEQKTDGAVTADYGTAPAFSSPVFIEDLGLMGDQRIIRITAIAANYWPNDDKLQVFSELKAILRFDFDDVPTLPDINQETFVIVSNPEFSEPLQPFAEWKRRQGFNVVEINPETSAPQAVKFMLQTLYDNATPLEPAPKYIMIVGDVDRIGTFLGQHSLPGESNHYTDLYYGEFTGDYLPETMVGRISVSNTLELQEVINKIIAYEQFLSPTPEYFQRALLVAGKEPIEPAPTTTNGQVNYVKNAFSDNGLDTSCYYNPDSYNQRDEIVSDIIRGAGIVNYTAHCYFNAWARPVLSMAQVDTLETTLPGIYINNCCSSNNFYVNCLGETLLRKPIGGAVGVIGATDLTLWEEDYYWSIGAKYPLSLTPTYDPYLTGAFDAMTLNSATLGEMILAGNMAVTQSGSPYDATYWEIYSLLGDPSMRPWLGTIDNLALSVPDTATAGLTRITISGTPGAKIAITQNDKLLATDTILSDSTLTLNLHRGIVQGTVFATATKANHRPITDTITVVANGNGIAVIDNIVIDDTCVSVTLRNVGEETLDGHKLGLIQTPSDSLNGALIDTANRTFGPLATNADTTITLPLTITTRGEKWLLAHLTLSDSNGFIYAITPINKTLETNPQNLKLTILDSVGNTCHRLENRKTYTIHGKVEGEFDLIKIKTTFPPFPTSDSLETSDTVFNIRTILPDSSRYLYIYVEQRLGRHIVQDSMWLNICETGESFEGGGFAGYPWQHPTLRPWTIDSAMSRRGRFCARSGAVANRQTSDLQIVINVMSDDSIAFSHKTSSQPGDALQFSIDGEIQDSWSGITNWQRDIYAIPEGLHTLRWRYVKDESGAEGDDCVWIDDIEWPLAAWQVQCVWYDSMPLNSMNIAQTADTWKIWPNPAGETVMLSAPEPCTVEIFNPVGQKVGETKIEKNSTPTQYFTHNLRYGIYVVVFKSHRNTVAKKLVIAR